MRKVSTKIYNLLIVATVAIFFVNFQATAQNYEKYYQDGRLYVKFVDSYNPQIQVADDNSVNLTDAVYFSGLIEEFQVQKITRPFNINNDQKLLRTFEFLVEDHFQLESLIAKLELMPEIEYAEKVPMHYTDFQPNDPLYNLVSGLANWNWHLDVIQAELAWDITQGSADVKVAVVDNAVWTSHPDLENKIVAQYDAVYNAPNANPPGTGDPGDWSHGTHCSGLVAAHTNNNIGVAGIGFNASIIAVKSSNNNSPNIIYMQPGVSWAINNGAHIVSMSFGGSSYSQTEQNLFNAGNNLGIVFFGSAGNEDSSTPRYPASYNHVISVASTDENDSKSWFSSYGATVDISSPGGSGSSGPQGVLSTTYSSTSLGNYDSYFGTSMACPVAAGLGSLILSINPALTPSQVEQILKSTADNIDAQNPTYIGQLGAGRINAYQAVLAVPFNPQPNFMVEVPIIMPGTTVQFQDVSAGIPSSWAWSFQGGSPSTSASQNPTITYNTEGVFDVALQVTNQFGSNVIQKPGFITVTATPSPWVMIAAGTTTTCIDDPVAFEDLSLYNPTSWVWSFEPDTYEFVEGTNANSQNPVVVFTNPDIYTLTVNITNANGTSSKTYDDYIKVNGMVLPYEDDFESGSALSFELESSDKSTIRVNARAANDGDFGIHFTGYNALQGWTGGPFNTTAQQAWEVNTEFHSAAHACNVDASDFAGVYLQLDLKQTYSLGPKLSWFRVLVNDEVQVPDVEGNFDFNPVTNNDPFVTRLFNLQPWAGQFFNLKLQASTRLFDGFYAEGDNVFVDNVKILGSLVGVDELVEIPFDVVNIYPNPANSILNIQFNSNSASDIKVAMTSASGQVVYQTNTKAGIGTTMIPVSVAKLPKGVYVVSITSANGVSSHKVVIE